MNDAMRRLDELLESMLAGPLTAAERAELNDLLRTSLPARRHFMEYLHVDGRLAWDHAVSQQDGPLAQFAKNFRETVESAAPRAPIAHARSPRLNYWRLATWLSMGVAAALMIMLVTHQSTTPTRSPAGQPSRATQAPTHQAAPATTQPANPTHPSAMTSVYAARITGDSDVQWPSAESQPSSRARLLAGQILEIKSGLLEVTFSKGASVVLEGPARFMVVDSNTGLLYGGRLSTDVPKMAKGFRVTTPSAQLVDLGTRFGVAVEGDVTQTKVFEGVVDGVAVDRQGHRVGREIRLTGGQAAQFVMDEMKPVSVDAQTIHFTRRLPNRIEPVTIADAATPDRKLIRPVGVTSRISGSFHPLERLIDGSGLMGEGPELTRLHAGNTEGNLLEDRCNWKANTNLLPIELVFDLGGVYDLKDVHLWNYSHPMRGMYQGRDARHIDVWSSLDGTTFQSLGSLELKVDEEAAESVQSYPLAARARYVCLQVTSSWGDKNTNEVGLGEVRFEGTPVK